MGPVPPTKVARRAARAEPLAFTNYKYVPSRWKREMVSPSPEVCIKNTTRRNDEIDL